MKRKNNYKLAITFILIIVASGCEDFLDTYPKTSLNNALFWQLPKDADSYLIGLYGYMPGTGELIWDEMSDIACPSSPDQITGQIAQSQHDASLTWFQNQWTGAYTAIRGVNSLLENIENIPKYDNDEKNIVISQARFIRTFFYVRLVMLFGEVPLVTSTISSEEAKNVTQSSTDEIWDFVESELLEIANLLPLSYNSSNIGRITKGAAIAFNARAMLYAGRWNKAALYAKQVMDLQVYSLYPNFEKLFSYAAENNPEVILDRQYAKDIASHTFFSNNAPRSMLGSSNVSPSNNLIDAFQTINGLSIDVDPDFNPVDPYANRDPRLKYSVFLPAFSDSSFVDVIPTTGLKFDPRVGSGTADEVEVDYTRSHTGFNIKKYINLEDAVDRSNCGTNFILIRYADILLMYAEAKVELNQIDESVYEAINLVRNGRADVKMPSVEMNKTQEELRKIIRNERLVELSLEGLRYWDIRRWRIAHQVLQGPVPGMKYIRSGQTNVVKLEYNGIKWAFRNPRDYLFPIPSQELILNTNLVQNPESY